MKIRYLSTALLLWISTMVMAQSLPPAVAKPSFAGTWEGFMNDLPGLKITIQQNAEQIEGTAVFYFQSLGADKQWHVSENGPAVPLLDPKVKDNVLSFEVPHHKCHGCTELGPNVKFVMRLTGAHEALLYQIRNDSKDDSPSGQGLKLIRRQQGWDSRWL